MSEPVETSQTRGVRGDEGDGAPSSDAKPPGELVLVP